MPSYIGASGSFSHMKNLNLEKVYRTIVLYSPISRADISRLTGLNKVTVSNCIKSLIAEDIVREEGAALANGGRPPVMLRLSDSFGVIIGVEISRVSTNVIVTDLCGNILEKTIREPKAYSPEGIIKLIDSVISDCNIDKTTKGVIGMGIALPLNYNKDDEVEVDSALPGWEGVDAKKLFKKHFPKVNIEILNTAAAGTIGEIHHGSANPDTYLAYIHGNWHLKMDVYGGGETYSSDSSFAGRFGQILVDKGKTLDDVASVMSIVEKFYPNEKMSRLDAVMDIRRRLKEGDKKVEKAVLKSLDYLAIGIYDICQLFRPEQICIGGYLGAALAGKYEDELNEKVLKLLGPDNSTKVTCSDFGVFNVGFGCISWIRDNIISYVFGD